MPRKNSKKKKKLKKRISRHRYPKRIRKTSVHRDFYSPEYKRWRTNVFIRDGYQCKMPGCNSKRHVQAHHIDTWANNAYTRFSVDNGITLCRACHERIHKKESHFAPLFKKVIAYRLLHRLRILSDGPQTKSNKGHPREERVDV